jgi:hypothetical protein
MMDSTQLEELTLDKVLLVCSVDRAFRQEFISNPREVLDKLGVEFAKGFNLQVVEVPENTMVIGLQPLIDEEATA